MKLMTSCFRLARDLAGASFSAAVMVCVCYGQNLAVTNAPGLGRTALTEFALNRQGDPARGRQIFADETKAACVRCHTTDGLGVKAGPDLSAIADKFPRRELIRSILEPSSTIAVGYGTTVVTTKDDEEVQGVIKQATESWIELVGGDGKPVRTAMSDIKEQRTTDTSLMPEGFEATLKPQEFVDLIAYLETLHQPIDSQTKIQGMPENIPQAAREVELLPFFDRQVQLNHPVWCSALPGSTNRFVILEHGGKSWLIERTPTGDQQTLLVDLSGQVRVGGATGLL